MKTTVLFGFLFWFSITANAQALVYRPMNPNFGGDTFNYQQLLSSADAQNDFKEDDKNKFKQPTQLERFKENLNNQLLNKISNSLFEEQFGSNGVSEGTYNFGTLSVDVYPSNVGLIVDILDTETGEQTQVVVPGG
jgi:curli production assembly/transport component CsgF